jgi:hypothetical protein
MKKLMCHQKNPQNEVFVDYVLGREDLIVNFEVHSKHINAPCGFDLNPSKNWGLWHSDVVECFFGPKGEYLEINLAPNNLAFNLMVLKPRELSYTPLDYKFSHETSITDWGWKASLVLPLSYFDDTKIIHGNFFACLGKEDSREYFGLNINVKDEPNFHRPELFLKL